MGFKVVATSLVLMVFFSIFIGVCRSQEEETPTERKRTESCIEYSYKAIGACMVGFFVGLLIAIWE